MEFTFEYDLYCNFEYKKGKIIIPKQYPNGEYYSQLDKGKKKLIEGDFSNFLELLNTFFEEMLNLRDKYLITPTPSQNSIFQPNFSEKNFDMEEEEEEDEVFEVEGDFVEDGFKDDYNEWLKTLEDTNPPLKFTEINTNSRYIKVSLKHEEKEYFIILKYESYYVEENFGEGGIYLSTEQNELRKFIEKINEFLKENSKTKVLIPKLLTESKFSILTKSMIYTKNVLIWPMQTWTRAG
jgi:hypothetical protein